MESLLNLFRKSVRQNPNHLKAFTAYHSCEVCEFAIISGLNHPLFLVVLFPLRNMISGVINSHWFEDVPTMRARYSFTKEKTFSFFGHQFSFGRRGLVSSYAEHTTSRRKISREFGKGPAAPSSSSCWGCGGSQGRNPGLVDTDTNLLNQQELTVSGWTHPCRVRIPASPMARNGISRERPVLSLSGIGHFGELAEWFKAPVLKTGGRAAPGVRIPHSPLTRKEEQ